MTTSPEEQGRPAAEAANMEDDFVFQRAAEEAPLRVRRRRKRKWWKRRTFRRRLRIAIWVAAGFAAIVLVQLVWAVWHLQAAGSDVAGARAQLAAGNIPAAESLVGTAHDKASLASYGTWGPHLAALQYLPLLGDDLKALRTVTYVSREATGPLATKLFAVRDTLDPEKIRPVNGKVDLEQIRLAGDQFGPVADELDELDDRTQDLALRPVVAPLRDPLLDVVDELHKMRSTADYSKNVLGMLPAALGAEGPRNYLVVFQNNSEFRATGGIPGSFAVLHADKGQLDMLDQGTGVDINRHFKKSILPPTREERLLFDGKLGLWVQDTNLTPDWSRSGQLLSAMWDEASPGKGVDGVLSVDPVALSYVLRGSGPVALPRGKVATAQNAAQLLLNQAYLELPTQQEQNDFFEDSARAIFDALIMGTGDAATSLRGMFDATKEGRGYVWMKRPDEQQRITGSIADGIIAREAGDRPDIGVFINDSTETKLEYYVTSRTDVIRGDCAADGSQRLTMRTHLQNSVPASVARVGYQIIGEQISNTPGDLALTILAYGPVGSTIVDSTLDGKEGAPSLYEHHGHPVIARTVILPRGEAMDLTWTIVTGPDQPGVPIFRTTPGAQTSGRGVMVDTSCPRAQ